MVKIFIKIHLVLKVNIVRSNNIVDVRRLAYLSSLIVIGQWCKLHQLPEKARQYIHTYNKLIPVNYETEYNKCI